MGALLINNGLFVFHGDTYLHLNLLTKEADNLPKAIQATFSIPYSTIDAALRWDDQTVFFFKGMDCVKYDLTKKGVAPGYPKKILFEWKGIWPSDLSDAIRINDKVIFFRRTQYISYDIQLGKADNGYPKPITEGWHGVWDNFDGVEHLGEGKVLFLKENHVIQYDLNRGQADAGYPVTILSFLQSYGGNNTPNNIDTAVQTIRDYVSAIMSAMNWIASSYLSAIRNFQTTIQTASPSDIRPNILSSVLRSGLTTAEKLMVTAIKETTETELRPIVDLIHRISDEIEKVTDQAHPGADWMNEIRLFVTNACMPDQGGENLQAQLEDEYKRTDSDVRRRYIAGIKKELTAIQTVELPSVEKLELAMYIDWINQDFDDDRSNGTGYICIQFTNDGTLSSATVNSPLGDKIAMALNGVMTKAGVARLAELDVAKKVCKGDISVYLERNNVVRQTTMNNEAPMVFAIDDAWKHVPQFTT